MRSARALRVGEAVLAVGGGLVLFGMMLLGIADVVLRYVFNSPIPGAAELLELGLGVLVFTALPLVTAHREHVTVELFTLPPQSFAGRLQASLTNLLSAGIVVLIAWQIGETARDFASYGDTSSYLRLPLAPIAWFMSGMGGLSAVILFIHTVMAWLPTRPAERPAGAEDMASIERGAT